MNPHYKRLSEAIAEEYKRQKKLLEQTNDIYIPLYDNKNRYLVLMGGAGSGKSIFAGRKILNRTVSEKGHRFLIVRKVAKTLRESCFQQLRGQISEYYDSSEFEINKTDMKITYKNGNEIIFAGLDDVEKLKSIYNITGIWIEEASELNSEDFRQLDIRLRGETKHYKQIVFSFNPVSITHWLKTEFFDQTKADSLTVKTTYKDNKFLDKEAIAVLEGFKETDPYYYMVYCQGEWGVLGKTIFNAQIVTARIMQLRDKKPLKRGYFTFDYVGEKIVDGSIKWVEDNSGDISIYEDVKKGYPYAGGGDTAGEGSDWFGGHIVNNVTGVQCAVLHQLTDEDLYARQMYCLGKYYNYALLAIETNFSTHPVKELLRLGYYRQYEREVPDTYTGALRKTYGFQTGKVTRPLIIAELVQIVRESCELINDITTLDEMLTFVKNEQGKPEAQDGKHDDLLMSLAITFHARTQQSFEAESQIEKNQDDEEDEDNSPSSFYD